MDGRRAVTRVDGVSGAASKITYRLVPYSTLASTAAFRVLGLCGGIGGCSCFIAPADCQLQGLAQRTRPQACKPR